MLTDAAYHPPPHTHTHTHTHPRTQTHAVAQESTWTHLIYECQHFSSSKSAYSNFWLITWHEDWSNDAENSVCITGINYILKYILYTLCMCIYIYAIILSTMWYFSFSFLINLQKCQQFCVFLSRRGAVCTLMRKKNNLNDFSKWLQYNKEWKI